MNRPSSWQSSVALMGASLVGVLVLLAVPAVLRSQPSPSQPVPPVPAQETLKRPATLVVRLAPTAELTIGDVVTRLVGPERRFESPPLPPGKHVYRLKAVWMVEGKEHTRAAVVDIEAGQTVVADLTKEDNKEVAPVVTKPIETTPQPVKPETAKVEKPKPDEMPKLEVSKPKPPITEQAPKLAPLTETPKVEPKQEDPKVAKVPDPKKEEPKKEEPKVAEPKALKVETSKVEAPKLETPKVEALKVEAPKSETLKKEDPKHVKLETPKKVEFKELKIDLPKVEVPKEEPKKEEVKTVKVDVAKKPHAKKPAREPDIFYVPTPDSVADKMLELAQVTKNDLVYDLGCGDGRLVIAAAKNVGAHGVGIDIDPARVHESLDKVKKQKLESLVTINEGDLFTSDFSDATVVLLYLHPDLNARLLPKLAALKPGTRIVSHDFDMKGAKPKKMVTVSVKEEGGKDHVLYLWTVPFDKE